MNTDIYDTIVIGSGPAGLAAAWNSIRHRKKTLLLEKMSRPGLKLLASGGGKCNVSNTLALEEFAMRFGRNWRFMLPALREFHGEKLLGFFENHGVPLVLDDGFHYFPSSEKATDVLNIFLQDIRKHAELLCSCEVRKLHPGEMWHVSTSAGAFQSKQVICCCGGRGYPALGGSMAGFDLLAQLGHTVTPLYPAMTGVICSDDRIGECAGISLPDCRATIAVKGLKNNSARGELLFTHRGFSAFAILDLAGTIAMLTAKNGSIPLKIDFLPEVSKDALHAEFAAWRKNHGAKHVSNMLSKFMPKKLALLLQNGDDPEVSRWRAESSNALLHNLKEAEFNITGTENWDKAMVTMGGISLKEVAPETLESKLFANLFFAGEMLDITGPCGGFNITWALASGMLAGAVIPSAKED